MTLILIILSYIGFGFLATRVLPIFFVSGTAKVVQAGWHFSITQNVEVDGDSEQFKITTRIVDNRYCHHVSAYVTEYVNYDSIESTKKSQLDTMKIKLKRIIKLNERIE